MPIYLASSPGFIAVATVFYLSAALALCLIAWHWLFSLCLFCLLVLDYVRIIYLHGLRVHKNSVSILIKDCDKWQYQLFSGKQYRARLLKERSYISQLLIVIYLKTMTQGRYVIIPRDALSKHNYRFIAMQLRS